MGLLKGKASFSVLLDKEGKDHVIGYESIRQKLEAWAFKDIDDTYDDVSIGFVPVHDMFSADFSQSIIDPYVAIALRVDERRVPGAVLKKYVLKEEQRVREERQVPRLSRMARLEIKERVGTELRRKAKPTPKVVELVWDMARGVVFVFSMSDRVIGVVEAFFKETFGITLEREAGDDDLLKRRDFLTWLFCRYFNGHQGVVAGMPGVVADGDLVSVKCRVDTHVGEIVTALTNGNRVSRLTIELDNGLKYTVSAKGFEITAAFPKTTTEDSDRDGLEAIVYDRMGMVQVVRDDLRLRYERFCSETVDITDMVKEISESQTW